MRDMPDVPKQPVGRDDIIDYIDEAKKSDWLDDKACDMAAVLGVDAVDGNVDSLKEIVAAGILNTKLEWSERSPLQVYRTQ